MNESPYNIVNIRDFFKKSNSPPIGENALHLLLSNFSSPKNIDVEHFIKYRAIEFTNKHQSVIYLVLSKERVSHYNFTADSYTFAAYLIAQLGKNYALNKEKQIAGNVRIINF